MQYTLKSLLLLNLFALNASAQSKYAVTAIGGLDYSYRVVRGDSWLKSKMVPDEPGLGFRAGLDFSRTLNKRWGLKAGIRYLNTGFRSKEWTNITVESGYDPVTGTFNPDPYSLDRLQFTYRYHYLEIPVGIRYQLGQKRLSCFLEAGAIANVYLSNKVSSSSELGSSHKEMDGDPFHKVGLGCYLSFGVQYRLNSGLQLFLQPTGRYNISPLTKEGPLKYHLYSIGAEIGVRYLLP
jgi:hypothetical protein